MSEDMIIEVEDRNVTLRKLTFLFMFLALVALIAGIAIGALLDWEYQETERALSYSELTEKVMQCDDALIECQNTLENFRNFATAMNDTQQAEVEIR